MWLMWVLQKNTNLQPKLENKIHWVLGIKRKALAYENFGIDGSAKVNQAQIFEANYKPFLLFLLILFFLHDN